MAQVSLLKTLPLSGVSGCSSGADGLVSPYVHDLPRIAGSNRNDHGVKRAVCGAVVSGRRRERVHATVERPDASALGAPLADERILPP